MNDARLAEIETISIRACGFDRDIGIAAEHAAAALELVTEVRRLRASLGECTELAEEAIDYAPQYFVDKWELKTRVEDMKKALKGTP